MVAYQPMHVIVKNEVEFVIVNDMKVDKYKDFVGDGKDHKKTFG